MFCAVGWLREGGIQVLREVRAEGGLVGGLECGSPRSREQPRMAALCHSHLQPGVGWRLWQEVELPGKKEGIAISGCQGRGSLEEGQEDEWEDR